ncbi:MAG: hypothetical protein RLZZ01_1902 [Actinomycetota bacterium]
MSAPTNRAVSRGDARPAWLVLDAARSHRFTGEVVFRTQPVVRVSFDRGEIYYAERTSDASLGRRLVDAGVLTSAQVERGSVVVGGVRHLGRLLDRVPDIDPHALLVAVDLLTDECVSWLASRPVSEVAWLPYRRHASGLHQWHEHRGRSVAALVDPMLSPLAASALKSGVDDVHTDLLDEQDDASFEEVTAEVRIEWAEPVWLDDTVAEPVSSGDHGGADHVDESHDTSASDDDWTVDVPVTPSPGSGTSRRRRPDHDPIDRFELVWPSGEVDDQLGSIEEPPAESEPIPAAEESTDAGAPERPSTSIRRASSDVSPTNEPVEPGADVDADVGEVAESGIDVHPASRRRMLPRRR